MFDPRELEAAAEFSTKDRDAAGSVDFVVLLNSFVISILEVRLFCHADASFLCISKLGVNAVKSICGNQCVRLGDLATVELSLGVC